MPAPVLVVHHPPCRGHDAGPAHPERPDRIDAVARGIEAVEFGDAVEWVGARPAALEEPAPVHDPNDAPALRQFCERGGGRLDTDTHANEASFEAASLAAGAVLDAVERIERGEGHNAFCAVRPPRGGPGLDEVRAAAQRRR